jgi:hypothetical protein
VVGRIDRGYLPLGRCAPQGNVTKDAMLRSRGCLPPRPSLLAVRDSDHEFGTHRKSRCTSPATTTSAQDAPRDVQFNYDTIHLEVGRILIASGAIDLDTLISKVTAISGKISTISKIELPQRQFSVGTRST